MPPEPDSRRSSKAGADAATKSSDAAAAPDTAAAAARAAMKTSAAEAEAIGVFARLKPVGDAQRGEVEVPKRFGKQKSVQMRNLEFSLDWIFTETEPQKDVYQIAAYDRVSSVLAGYNATILAYGQTGSGKTHTMFGPDEVLSDFLTLSLIHISEPTRPY